VEIKDGDDDASNVRIDIEKTGPSELQTDGVRVNQTLFDVGHASIFVLQLVRARYIHTSHYITTIYSGLSKIGYFTVHSGDSSTEWAKYPGMTVEIMSVTRQTGRFQAGCCRLFTHLNSIQMIK